MRPIPDCQLVKEVREGIGVDPVPLFLHLRLERAVRICCRLHAASPLTVACATRRLAVHIGASPSTNSCSTFLDGRSANRKLSYPIESWCREGGGFPWQTDSTQLTDS